MTPEERAAKERKLKELKLQKLKAQRAAMQAAPEREEIAATDARGLTRAAGQGALMGWGDEATGFLTATAAKASHLLPGKQPGEGQSWGEIYDDVTGLEREGYDQYAEDNPIAALGMETVGGLVTGRAPIPKFLRSPGLGATRKARLGKWAARNAAEGAISGAGVSDENRLVGAGVGAGLGMGLGGLMEAAPGLVRTAAKRRVKAPAGQPLHMQIPSDATGAEGALGTFYRQGVGGSFGGRQALRNQEQPFLDAADAAAARTKREAEDTRDLVNIERDVELDDMAIGAQRKQAEIQAATQDQVDDVTAKATAQAERIKNKPAQAKVAEAKQLRRQAVDAAMPERVGGKARQNIQSADPETANGLLNDWWRSNGFGTVKRNRFDWNDGELVDTLKKVVKEDPGLELSISQAPGMTKNMVKKLLKLKKGETPTSVSGEQLMAIRNVFAMASNNTSKKFEKGALRRVANEFDDFIRKGLDGDDLAGFEDDLVKYGPTRLFGDAVDKAYKKNGAFDADDWLSVLPRDARSKRRGLLQTDAQAARSRIGAAEKSAQDVLKRGGELPTETRTLTKALKRQGRKEARDASAGLRKARRGARQKYAKDPRLLRTKAAREAAKESADEMGRRAVPGTSWPSQMVTTGAFGSLPAAALGAVGGPLGLATGLVLGRNVSKKMAKQGTQDVLAGRTQGQRKLAAALRKYRRSPTAANAQALRRATQGMGTRETMRYFQEE